MANYITLIVHGLGWGCCALGGWSGARNAWQLTQWERGYGKVIGYETRPNGDSEESYHPKIKVSGLTSDATFVSDLGSHQKSWKVGAKVRILYRRTESGVQGEVFSWLAMIGPPALLLALGIFFLLLQAD